MVSSSSENEYKSEHFPFKLLGVQKDNPRRMQIQREALCVCECGCAFVHSGQGVQEAQSGRNWGHVKENYRK